MAAHWQLIESAGFTDGLSALGDVRVIDDALTAVIWALSTNPEAFPLVPGMVDIRLAKTDPASGTPIPRMRVWFPIDENSQRVHLEHVEFDPFDFAD
ncbi:MAG: hypothetical protein Q7R41_17335 [Phycisphaerales bacterium]|nr:hypothetical protein [Phycisphaerales bacterium]